MYALCISYFCFLQLIVLSRSPCPPPLSANSSRTAVQNVTSTSTQHSAGQLALHKHLLALLSIRYSHQIITGLLFLPPLHMFQLHSSVRERSGRRQPPAERSPVLSLEPHKVPPGIRRSTRYQVPVVRACTRLFAFVFDFVLHLGSLRNFFFANYTRTTADQNVTSPTNNTAQTGQSAPHK